MQCHKVELSLSNFHWWHNSFCQYREHVILNFKLCNYRCKHVRSNLVKYRKYVNAILKWVYWYSLKGGVYLIAFSCFSTTLCSLKTKFIKIDFSHWLFLRASLDLLTEDLAFLLPSHSGIEMHPAVCTHDIIPSNQEFYTKAMFCFVF